MPRLITRVIVPTTSDENPITEDTFSVTNAEGSITKVIVQATSSDSMVARDIILTSNIGGPITRDITSVVVSNSPITEATIPASSFVRRFSHWTFGTSGSSGRATNFGDLLENFYLSYQTPKNILLNRFTCKVSYMSNIFLFVITSLSLLCVCVLLMCYKI